VTLKLEMTLFLLEEVEEEEKKEEVEEKKEEVEEESCVALYFLPSLF
jgi:hypothetical protein